MRKPKKPPRTVLSDHGDHQRIVETLSAVPTPLAHGKYLHWDELVRREPPEGLSHEDWWFGLKLNRRISYKHVPLNDKKGRPFSYLEIEPIPEQLHEIDLRAGGRIRMPEQIVNPDTRDQYFVGSLMEEAIASSQLEGAATTRIEAKEMLRSKRSPRDNSEQMILNNFVTMRRIHEVKDEGLSRELVFEIHRLVTEGTLSDTSAPGRFRSEDEEIRVVDGEGEVLHVPPPAEELDERLAALCDFANGKTPAGFVHPAIRSIILHFWFAYDHPFVDGNGRTARALFYWSMLHHGHWLFEFVSISSILLKAPAKYSRAFLYTESDENDLTYFIIYQLKVIRRAVDELHKYLERKTRDLEATERELKGVIVLNHRQRALISHAMRHPHQLYTVESHRMSQQVVYQTARTDLLDLRDRGLFDVTKVGRTMHFTPAADIRERLSRTP